MPETLCAGHLTISNCSLSDSTAFNSGLTTVAVNHLSHEGYLLFELSQTILQCLHSIDNMTQRQNEDADCRRGGKMAEIESYVSLLIDNNQTYLAELTHLRQNNSTFRTNIELLMRQNLQLKQSHQQELLTLKELHNAQVTNLITELKDILRQREQMEQSYKTIIEQLTFHTECAARNRQAHCDDMEHAHQIKVRKLSDRIAEQIREADRQHHETSETKLRMVQQIDDLTYTISELKRHNGALLQQNAALSLQVDKNLRQSKQTSQELDDQTVITLRLEQEKNAAIVELKKSNSKFKEEVDRLMEALKKSEHALGVREKDLSALSERHEQLKKDKQMLQGAYFEVTETLGTKESSLKQIETEFARLSDLYGKEQRRMNELIRLLENDGSRFMKEKEQAISQSATKQAEIHTLLQKIANLEADKTNLAKNVLQFQEENIQLKRAHHSLNDQMECLELQCKSQQEKILLQVNHIATLEHLAEKEKRRGGADKENALTSRLESQIEEILRNALSEKNQMREAFKQQKERLLRVYETALRDKEQLFKQRIAGIEVQIRELH